MRRYVSEEHVAYSREDRTLVDLGGPLLDRTNQEVDRAVRVERYTETHRAKISPQLEVLGIRYI